MRQKLGSHWTRSERISVFIGTTFVVTALVAASCDAAPTAATELCDDTIGQRVTALINEFRAAEGLGPLTVDTRLIESAQGHSVDMATSGFVGHTGADGSNAGARIDRAGYSWSYYSENVAAGQTTPEVVVAGWMGSEGHRKNILSADGSNLGVGYVQQAGTEFEHYWTVNFGATSAPVSAPPGGCHP